MNKTEKAFKWIVGILQEQNIPFQISGGMAARIYGVDRPLADIDIELPDAAIEKMKPLVEEYIIYGPERYKDDEFDLLLMTLNYHGQEIDLAGADTDMVFNKATGEWESCETDLSTAETHDVFGLQMPVIRKDLLIAYKKKIAREVDLIDVEQLKAV